MSKIEKSKIDRIPFYIETGRDVLLAWCHLPEKPTDHAVIICPPVGHEFINSYRGLRHLADGFARVGVTVFRVEYQGVGDSSGLDTDSGRIQNWLSSIEHVHDFIRENCGVKHISLFGLRMGATLANMFAEKRDVVSLMCWVPVVEGKRYIREMLALQRTGENAGLEVDSTSLEGGGFLITRETMNELSALSMLKMAPTRAGHLFFFQSDDLPVSNELIQRWSSLHADFQYASLPGYAEMMELPHNSKIPFEALDAIIKAFMPTYQSAQEIERTPFIDLKQYQQCSFDCHTYGSTAKESMDAGGAFPVSETICQFSEDSLFGIMSRPLLRDGENRPCVLLLNSGAVHRVGPNRNYVYLSRQLLSLGFCVMRMDFLGLGDSINPDIAKENNPYMPEALENIRAAVIFLKDTFEIKDVILMGVCSGAYASFQAAIHTDDPAIREVVLVNPLAFYWKDGMSLDVPALEHHWNWNRYSTNVGKSETWMKLLKGKINIKNVFKTVIFRLFARAQTFAKTFFNALKLSFGVKPLEDLSYDLNQIQLKGIKMNFVFADLDPGYRILMESAGLVVNKLSKTGQVEVSVIAKSNHNFSSHLGRSRLLAHVSRYFSSRYG